MADTSAMFLDRRMRLRGPSSRRLLVPAIAAWLVLTASGCSKHTTAPSAPVATRSWRMGFSAIPPVPDFTVLMQALQMWTPRADAAISHEAVPWDSLLAGIRADSLVLRNVLPLAQYYRGQHLAYTYEIDPTNGLDRSAEDPALVRLGRSIAEPEIAALFRRWAAVIDSMVAPDYLGIASETNLIRAAAPAPLYAALVQLAHSTADTLAAIHARTPRPAAPVIYTSVQVETAWGVLGTPTGWQGIATDLADFPAGGVLGLSSYPFFAYAQPESIPADYYSRIATAAGRPVMVVEGGWSSASVGTVTSSPAAQARYLRRQSALLGSAHAIGCYQLNFTDMDLAYWPPQPPGSILPLFASLGLVDVNLAPRPALAVWDSVFALPRRP